MNDIFNAKTPKKRIEYCCHEFKDENCKYNGNIKSCDKTRKMCIKLQGGLLNYGAWITGKDPLIQKGIK